MLIKIMQDPQKCTNSSASTCLGPQTTPALVQHNASMPEAHRKTAPVRDGLIIL